MSQINWTRVAGYGHTVGFSTRVAIKSRGGSGKGRLHFIDLGAGCREELAGLTRDELIHEITSWESPSRRRRAPSGGWFAAGAQRRVQGSRVDLNDTRTRQPGITYLYLGEEDSYGYGDPLEMCPRACCTKGLIEAFDALVGLPCLLLNPTRFRGNWWQTSEKELLSSRQGSRLSNNIVYSVRWYGTDNFFLRHPALISIVTGLFRQAYALHAESSTKGLEKAAPREQVIQALDESDEKRAWRLVQKLRPWLEAGRRSSSFPFQQGQWELFEQLHRAIYREGYDKVFGTNFIQSWGGIDGERDYYYGFQSYLGGSGSAARKRLAQLGCR